MDHYSNKPFTIEDIIEEFNNLETQVNSYSNGPIYPGFIKYSAHNWFRKLFPDDAALNPRKGDVGYRYNPHDYIHYRFEFCKKDYEGIYWKADFEGIINILTIFFGFFRDDKTGNLVQINPAALHLLHFNKSIPFSKILKPKYTRIIHLGKDDNEFFWARFRYYMFALTDHEDFGRGLKQFNGRRKKDSATDEAAFYGVESYFDLIPMEKWKSHWLFTNGKRSVDTINYLRERSISPAVAIQDLLPLGTLPIVGYHPKLECTEANKCGDRVPTLKEIQDFYKEKENIAVFRGGVYYKRVDYEEGELPSENLKLSAEQQMFHKYCLTYIKKKDWIVPLNTFKEEMISFGVYPPAIVKRKNFMKDIVTRDAKAMGYSITCSRKWVVDDQTGEKSRASVVTIEKESYGRNKK